MTYPGPLGQEILELLREHFFHREVFEKWRTDGHAAALEAAAELKDAQRLNELLSFLGISHTRRFTSDQIDYYYLLYTYSTAGLRSRLRSLFPNGVVSYPGIGVAVTRKDRRYFVSAVVPGGPAERAALLAGDELVSVDDRPYEPVASFRDRDARVVSVSFRRDIRGSILHAEIIPTVVSAGDELANASRDGARVLDRHSKSIAFFKPWSLAGDRHWRVLVKALSGKLRNCDALVLDLRGGIGGASPDCAEFFVGRSPELTLLGPRQEKRVVNPHWRKPVVLIVDRTTRSGSEVLAFALQRAGIPVVGTETPGEVTAAKPFILSDASLLLVATSAVLVDGATLEGRGVQPDVAVQFDVAYAAGNDPQLDAALELAAVGRGQKDGAGTRVTLS